jgi:nucleoside-diphosphate-sugar epimerase
VLSLVTGATGFIGGHLVDTLVLRGEEVRALVRPTSRAQRLRELGVDVRIGTLQDNATLIAAAKGVNRIFHCAALVSDWGTLEDFEQANVQGVRNILAAATRANIARFIHLSATDIYGYPGRPVDESERPSPRGFPYSDTKLEGETLVWNHHRRVGLPVCVIRPATVYGPRCQALGSEIIRALRERRMVMIDEGRCVAGLTYVGNLVDALMLAADNPAAIGQAYHITDGSQVTWREYVDALADLAELPRTTRSYSHNAAFMRATVLEYLNQFLGRNQRPALTRTLVERRGTDQDFPIDKAKRELGYRPRVSFAEGIRHTGDWLRREGFLAFGP